MNEAEKAQRVKIRQEMMEAAGALNSLSFYVTAGVPILEAVALVRDNYLRLRDIFQNMYIRIRIGEGVSEGFSGYENLFPKFVPTLVVVGEHTGELDMMLMLVARDVANIVNPGGNKPMELFWASEESVDLRIELMCYAIDYLALSVAIGAGMPADKSVKILSDCSQSKLKAIWGKVYEMMTKDQVSLPTAMSKFGNFHKEDVDKLLQTEAVAVALESIYQRLKTKALER